MGKKGSLSEKFTSDPKIDVEYSFEVVAEDRSYYFEVLNRDEAQREDRAEFMEREKNRLVCAYCRHIVGISSSYYHHLV